MRPQHSTAWELGLGARPEPGGGVRFETWAPRASRVDVRLAGQGRDRPLAPKDEPLPGYFGAVIGEARVGDDYLFVLDGDRALPDPASRWQPGGVQGPSRVVSPDGFPWRDAAWRGLPLKDFVIYELHVGTFSAEGNFDAIIPRLQHLRELGVTALELMPVAQFPGERNWGYDGVFPFAPQASYGGPDALKRLVDACHGVGLAVVLDVVYNHLGPEGNVLHAYGPYFTRRYRTPWGQAVNFDGRGSSAVRRFFVDNALYWLHDFHVDALRLDAVNAMHDRTSPHILTELSEAWHRAAADLGRRAHLIAESNLNDVRLLHPSSAGGLGMDAQWSDDFFRSVYALLSGERRGFLVDYGRCAHLAKAVARGFVLDGGYARHKHGPHGSDSTELPGQQLVVFCQNHDQIANTGAGQRLRCLVGGAKARVAAALQIFSPNLPLLFMGEEYGETQPFRYFTSHSGEALIRAVRKGRAREHAAFAASTPLAEPQHQATFTESSLDWDHLDTPSGQATLRYYQELLRLRRETAALADCRKDLLRVRHEDDEETLVLERGDSALGRAVLLCNFAAKPRPLKFKLGGGYELALWSEARRYGGDGGDAPPPRLAAAGAAGVEVQLGPSQAALYLERAAQTA